MTPLIMKGHAPAARLQQATEACLQQGALHHQRPAQLRVIWVGHDAASALYVKRKIQKAQALGMVARAVHLPRATTDTVLQHIDRANRDPTVDGLLVQLPLPEPVDTPTVLRHVDPEKDVDGLHPENLGLLAAGTPRFTPCTPAGICTLLAHHRIPLQQHVVLVGASRLVGRPLAMALLNQGATVTLCHHLTHDLAAFTRTADILISATGQPHLITPHHVRSGAVVIDVGTTRQPDGTWAGDVCFDTVAPLTRAITPVPGGVGPMTVASLMHHVATAYARSSSPEGTPRRAVD